MIWTFHFLTKFSLSLPQIKQKENGRSPSSTSPLYLLVCSDCIPPLDMHLAQTHRPRQSAYRTQDQDLVLLLSLRNIIATEKFFIILSGYRKKTIPDSSCTLFSGAIWGWITIKIPPKNKIKKATSVCYLFFLLFPIYIYQNCNKNKIMIIIFNNNNNSNAIIISNNTIIIINNTKYTHPQK